MPAHSPFGFACSLTDKFTQPGEGSRNANGTWQTVISKSGPRLEAVPPPLRKSGGRRIIPMEQAKLRGEGGRYMLMPANIM